MKIAELVIFLKLLDVSTANIIFCCVVLTFDFKNAIFFKMKDATELIMKTWKKKYLLEVFIQHVWMNLMTSIGQGKGLYGILIPSATRFKMSFGSGDENGRNVLTHRVWTRKRGFETERFFNLKCVRCFMRSKIARYVHIYKLHLYKHLKLSLSRMLGDYIGDSTEALSCCSLSPIYGVVRKCKVNNQCAWYKKRCRSNE